MNRRFLPSLGIIGDYVQMCREVTFDWQIRDFLSLTDSKNTYGESPEFRLEGSSWILRVYPNFAERVVSINLRMVDRAETLLHHTVGIKGTDGVEKRGRLREGNSVCWLISELKERESILLPDGVLTITCDVRFGAPIAVKDACIEADEDYTSPERIGGKKALQDFGKLLEGGEGSDVTVEVGGAEFPVHSAVLFARCPALSALLKHECRERSSRRIAVEDCDAEVFQYFLRYLYTGSPGRISNAFQLYRVADKYLVDNLKQQCVEHILDTLSVQTFCEAIQLALGYGEGGLLQGAFDFAARNIQSILCSGDWQNFIRENPTEANEIMIKSFAVLYKNPKILFENVARCLNHPKRQKK